MTISAKQRLLPLSGLLLLSLLLVALAVPAALAAGSGSDSSQQLTPAQVLGRHGGGTIAGTAAFTGGQAGTQGRGGVNIALLTPAQAGTQGRGGAAPLAQAPAAQSGSSSSTSSTTWIAIGSVLAALVIGITAWALIRRRSGDSASADYCVQHPEDPLCAPA